MANLGLKIAVLSLAFGAFLAFGILPTKAQTFSEDIVVDPEVLVSPAAEHSGPRHNLETTLVDIKAIDAPTLHTENGKTAIGSEIRNGQGIIIDSNGIIVTNRHVIGHALHIYVTLAGGQTLEATVLQNSQADLCLIKINAPLPLKAVSLADPSEIQIGKNVIAFANAGLNSQRIRGGQVIKIFKEISTNKAEILEMNIPLNPGDSGGPILNEDGSLLGLIMGKQISDPSKSYAIASSRIQQEYFKYRNSILN